MTPTTCPPAFMQTQCPRTRDRHKNVKKGKEGSVFQKLYGINQGRPNGKTTITKTPNQTRGRTAKLADSRFWILNPRKSTVTQTAACQKHRRVDRCSQAEVSPCMEGPTGSQPAPKSFKEEMKVFLTNGPREASSHTRV